MQSLIRLSHRHNGHPLLIAGIILGLIFGLVLAIPKGARGWVVAGILALVLWFTWTAKKDDTMAGTTHPVAMDYAPRAELVRLPNK